MRALSFRVSNYYLIQILFKQIIELMNMDKLMEKDLRKKMDTMSSTLSVATFAVERLTRFSAHFMSFGAFQKHIDNMEHHFSAYKEMWLMGHFTHSFHRKIKGLCTKYKNCDFRILAIDPGYLSGMRWKVNWDTLDKIEKEGGKVKIHKNLHARLFIGCNDETDTMCLIIGSYDYNENSYSGGQVNSAIRSTSPQLVHDAKTFFLEQWASADSLNIDEWFAWKEK